MGLRFTCCCQSCSLSVFSKDGSTQALPLRERRGSWGGRSTCWKPHVHIYASLQNTACISAFLGVWACDKSCPSGNSTLQQHWKTVPAPLNCSNLVKLIIKDTENNTSRESAGFAAADSSLSIWTVKVDGELEANFKWLTLVQILIFSNSRAALTWDIFGLKSL